MQDGHEWYKNLPEDKKQKLVEYRKKYYKIGTKRLIIIIRNYYFWKSNDLKKSFDGEWIKAKYHDVLTYKFKSESQFKPNLKWKIVENFKQKKHKRI